MEVIVILFVIPVVTLVGLAILPAGRLALVGHIAVASVAALAAMTFLPLSASNGPDDWFHGIELVPIFSAGISVVLVGIAQWWRWHRIRKGKETYYLAALLLCLSPILVIAAQM
ncbi:hypothetical protein [Celeribacter halophilus]|uniref:hypothetical protein n=1 Tax=Celeribacter halophilus TaxID=576117 RepID=UPI003A9483C4